MRLIDADRLFEVIEKSMAENPHKEKTQRAMHIHEHKYFLTLLTGFPTIQLEERTEKRTETHTCDSISRQAALQDDAECQMELKAYRDIRDGIKDEPTAEPPAQPEPHWIPCSERLPEYNESVLTWDGYVFCIEKRIPYIRDDDGEPIEGDWWVGDEYDEYESEYYPNLRDGAAIAWMPLPEPYRGGEEE